MNNYRNGCCILETVSRTLVLWAFDCAQIPLRQLEEKYPNEHRPRMALELCEAWARGRIKMPAAKRAILDAHAAAADIDDPAFEALCHAVGHAGATIHVETHALGLAFYELTSIVLRNRNEYKAAILEKTTYYRDRLICWQEQMEHQDRTWAAFLLDETRPNKEQLLAEKRQQHK